MNLKQILVTAVITCLFTVVAGVVTYLIITKEPGLSFNVSEGPSLHSPGGFRRIYVVAIQNPGRKEVVDLRAQIGLPKGIIDQTSHSASPGVQLDAKEQPDQYQVSVAVLNPEEHVTLSLMVTVPTEDVTPALLR